MHDAVKAREGVPGQAPAAPELMMALWLWATVDGVGSARQLTRMCEQHLAYRWLCGGVSMNYHTLSDFRVAHAAVLDQGAQHQPPIGDRRRAFPNPAAWLRVMRSWTACRQTSSRRYRRYRDRTRSLRLVSRHMICRSAALRSASCCWSDAQNSRNKLPAICVLPKERPLRGAGADDTALG